MRRLALALVVPLCSFVRFERIVVYTAPVRYAIDSIATVSALTHQEEAACIVRYTVQMGADWRIITPLALGPANVARQDTVSVQSVGWTCPDSVPLLHTHLRIAGYDTYHPSRLDDSVAVAHHMPFALLVIAGTGQIVPYGVQPQ